MVEYDLWNLFSGLGVLPVHEIIQPNLANIAIIFIMHLCINLLIIKEDKLPNQRFFVIGLISLTSLAVIAMFYIPTEFREFQFDLRLIPLIFFALKWGKYVIATLAITSLWRLGMGGVGAIPEVIYGMVFPVMLTFYLKRFISKENINYMLFLLVVGTWLLSDLPIIYSLSDGFEIFQDIAIYRVVFLLLTAYTLHFFIRNAEKEIELKEQLRYYAERDPLTNLYNIRHFLSIVRLRPESMKKKHIVLLDIDFFKSINDTHGHTNGDLLLKNMANLLLDSKDIFQQLKIIVGRYGGEEFILYLETESLEEMKEFVESLREEIEKNIFYTAEQKPITITVSIGVAELAQREDPYCSIDRADRLMYKSKNNGRNQIHFE